MFKVWINDGKNPKPQDAIFYEIAANGIFLHKNMVFWESVVPVDRISILKESKPSFGYLLPKIPSEIVQEIARFFAWIYQKQFTEVVALIFFNQKEKYYRVVIPQQEVGPASIRYDMPERSPDEYLVGTFHSHCAMDAFHSGVDEHDEMYLDGIHATFGKFSCDKTADTIAISLEAAVNGKRFKMDPDHFLLGIEKFKEERGGFGQLPERPVFRRWRGESPLYKLSGKSVILPDGYQPLPAWLEAVKIKQYAPFEWAKSEYLDKPKPENLEDKESECISDSCQRDNPSKEGQKPDFIDKAWDFFFEGWGGKGAHNDSSHPKKEGDK